MNSKNASSSKLQGLGEPYVDTMSNEELFSSKASTMCRGPRFHIKRRALKLDEDIRDSQMNQASRISNLLLRSQLEAEQALDYVGSQKSKR